MAPTVRAARPNDARQVAKLNEIVQQLHYDSRPDWFKAPDAEAFLPVVEDWLSSKDVAVFVAATLGGELVGYSIGVRHQRHDNPVVHGAAIVELDHVVVDPDFRGRGLGRRLSEAILQWAETLGAARVELSTWAFNGRAQRIVRKHGAHPDRPAHVPRHGNKRVANPL